jgi:sirohydrochlorin cobaltochelatase
MMSDDTVFVLVAHGSREPGWAEPLVRLAHGVGARLAFVEMGAPGVEEAVTGALAEGARTVKLLPLFMAVGRHVKRDIPASVEALRATHPGSNIEILPALGENERFWEALREIVRAQMETAAPARAPDQASPESGDPSDVGVTRRR